MTSRSPPPVWDWNAWLGAEGEHLIVCLLEKEDHDQAWLPGNPLESHPQRLEWPSLE